MSEWCSINELIYNAWMVTLNYRPNPKGLHYWSHRQSSHLHAEQSARFYFLDGNPLCPLPIARVSYV